MAETPLSLAILSAIVLIPPKIETSPLLRTLLTQPILFLSSFSTYSAQCPSLGQSRSDFEDQIWTVPKVF